MIVRGGFAVCGGAYDVYKNAGAICEGAHAVRKDAYAFRERRS